MASPSEIRHDSALVEHLPEMHFLRAQFVWVNSKIKNAYRIEIGSFITLILDRDVPVRPAAVLVDADELLLLEEGTLQYYIGQQLTTAMRTSIDEQLVVTDVTLSLENRIAIATQQVNEQHTPEALRIACRNLLQANLRPPDQYS